MSTNKKITRVGGESATTPEPLAGRTFVASEESKAKAKQWRLFAVLAWVVAIGIELYLIFGVLLKPPVNMTFLIIGIVVNLIPAILGSWLWKKANRLDPASEKDKTRFFLQNQLGAIMGVLAFLPLVILIFTNKDLSGKQKGIVGAIAVVAMLLAGIAGVDFNPPSVEEYTDQINQVEQLNDGKNEVFWTKSGTKYHLYSDCYHINTDKTDEIMQGSVEQARELKKITELCKTCEERRLKEKDMTTEEALPVETPEVTEEASQEVAPE
ncbi:MAG TPA: hypothetical protein DCX89_08770 [Saprospirales bacterium]|nr:hypothetical protein [Saprospirales bacterium]HRQ28738.1 hypothetical protein [Saprospiraceae bacterium]